MREYVGLDQGRSSGDGVKQLDSPCSLKVQHTSFANDLVSMGHKRQRGVKYGMKSFGWSQRKDGAGIY